jgi:hypothetical protein
VSVVGAPGALATMRGLGKGVTAPMSKGIAAYFLQSRLNSRPVKAAVSVLA